MRRLLIILAVALIAGAVVHQILVRQDGFLLLSAGPYVVETTLWGALVFAILALLAIYLLWKFWQLVVLPRSLWRQHRGKKRLKVRDQTVQGMLDYLGGDWPKAAANFSKGLKNSETPAINYLGAAAAHFNLGETESTHSLLQAAETNGASDELTAGLLRVRMLLQEHNFDGALALAQNLHRKQPSHPTVLRLLANTRKGISDWNGLESMLGDIRKHRALSSAEIESLERDVYLGLVTSFQDQKSQHRSVSEQRFELDRLWDRIPGRLQKEPVLVSAYVEQLCLLGEHKKAESRLRRFINRNWNDKLVALYGRIEEDPRHQLTVAEGWYQKHRGEPALLHALGRLCARNQLWGKAREYYEAALREAPAPELWLELGELLKLVQDDNGSRECFHKGLQQVVKK